MIGVAWVLALGGLPAAAGCQQTAYRDLRDHGHLRRPTPEARAPVAGLPANASDPAAALGASWVVDREGALWRGTTVDGPWERAHRFEAPPAPARWMPAGSGFDRARPPTPPPRELLAVPEGLFAIARDGSTWVSTDGGTWTFHPGNHLWPNVRPFVVDGQPYVDANVLHAWTGSAWVPVMHADNDAYVVDEARVYVARISLRGTLDDAVVKEGARGTARFCIGPDGTAEEVVRRLPVSGRRVGPWFAQDDGSALVVRGDDATMAVEAQWLRVSPDGEVRVLLEHGRPDAATWPLHASPSGLVAAGHSTGTLVWDSRGDAPPTVFPLHGDAVVATAGGAYLQVRDRIHWLDLSDGSAREVARIDVPTTSLVAAAPGVLWLEDTARHTLSRMDTARAKAVVVEDHLRFGHVWQGSGRVVWIRAEPGSDLPRDRRYTGYSAPLTGGDARAEGSGRLRALFEHDGRVLRVTMAEGKDVALWEGERLVGTAPDADRLVNEGFDVLGDRLVNTGHGIYSVPLTWVVGPSDGSTPTPP